MANPRTHRTEVLRRSLLNSAKGSLAFQRALTVARGMAWPGLLSVVCVWGLGFDVIRPAHKYPCNKNK